MVSSAALAHDMTSPDVNAPALSIETARADKVSVVVVVLVDEPGIVESYRAYRDALEQTDRKIEFIYVLDKSKPKALADLQDLAASDEEPLKVIALSRWDDEIGALKSAIRRASGSIILTLPAIFQVEPSDLEKVVDAAERTDLVVPAAERDDLEWFVVACGEILEIGKRLRLALVENIDELDLAVGLPERIPIGAIGLDDAGLVDQDNDDHRDLVGAGRFDGQGRGVHVGRRHVMRQCCRTHHALHSPIRARVASALA
jgi:glycosyltransferase involved in cell wall biosynthesis